MKNNVYMNTIENITAPNALVNKAVQRLNDADNTSEVIAFEKPKRRTIKFTAVAAAVLALIIGLNFIPFSFGQTDSNHNFVLTVGAAEITPETYITLGNLQESNETGLYRYIDEELKKVSVLEEGREYNLDIQCSGENIESITYTPHNAYLRFDPDFSGLIDFEELDIHQLYEDCVVSFPDTASKCTYDYNNQPRSFWDADEMGFEIPDDGYDGTVPLKMGVRFFFEEGELVCTLDDEDDVDLSDVVASEFNAHADDYTLDVTANFTDGTQATKTLKFMCDDSSTVPKLLVTEVTE